MEIKEIFEFVKKYYWIFLLGIILGLVFGLAYNKVHTKEYEGVSKVAILRNSPDKTSDYGYLTDAQLSATYAYVLTTQPILDAVASKVNSKVDIDQVTITPIIDTLILTITVKNSSPQKAAAIANAFADTLVEHNRTLQTDRYSSEEESMNAQILDVQTQINALETAYTDQAAQINQSMIADVDAKIASYKSQINTLETDIAAIGTPLTAETRQTVAEKTAKLNQIQPLLTLYQEIRTNLEYLGRPYQGTTAGEDQTLSHIQTAIDQYQSIYKTLLDALEQIQIQKYQNTPSVMKLEDSKVPDKPVSPFFLFNPVISALIGLILSIVIAVLLQYTDLRIPTVQDIFNKSRKEVSQTLEPAPKARTPRRKQSHSEPGGSASGQSFKK